MVLDGKFGSYSSNETYRETTYDVLQSRNNRILKAVNKQIIDPMMSLNYDAPGLFHIQPHPIDDDHVQTMFRLFPHLRGDPSVDQQALKESLGIPDANTADKFEKIQPAEAAFDTSLLDPDVKWLRLHEIGKKLNMADHSVRSAMKRFQPFDENPNNRPHRFPDGKYRIPQHIINKVFPVSVSLDGTAYEQEEDT